MITVQRNITSIEQFVAMKSADCRSLVRTLSDEEYADVMAMCSMLPHVDIEAVTQGMCLHGNSRRGCMSWQSEAIIAPILLEFGLL